MEEDEGGSGRGKWEERTAPLLTLHHGNYVSISRGDLWPAPVGCGPADFAAELIPPSRGAGGNSSPQLFRTPLM